MRKTALGIALVLVFLAAACLTPPFPVNAAPRTIVVPDDAQTITAALSYALNGDTILVKKGTYTQDTIVIDKAVTLIGEDANNTIIGIPTGNFPPIYQPPFPSITTIQVNANLAKISNFTIKNGGTAILVNGYLNRISNNIIAEGGGGIAITGSNNTISQNLILKNNVALSCSGSYNNIKGNNIIDSGPDGLVFTGPHNSIMGNSFENGAWGIKIKSDGNTFARNNLTNFGGILLENKASFNHIYANSLSHGGGIFVERGYNNVVHSNHVAECGIGLSVGAYQSSSSTGPYTNNNTIFHNNFVNNEIQVDTLYPVYGTNYFDNGKEGNYWSDYVSNDTNRDGIGDTPYIIDETRRDNYPLMFPWGKWEFSVSLPQNRSYSGSVPLVFVADRPAEWFSYSLDGLDNVTVAGNTTLTGLVEGWHTVTVYANDTLGNAGLSETISFLVDTQTALFQTLLVAVAVVAVAVVAGAGLLHYFKKQKWRKRGAKLP